MKFLHKKKILLIICGGIAAYKSLELIRLLKKNGSSVRCILTKGAQKFITPLSVTSLSQEKVFTDLFDPKSEAEMDHISLSRWADLILVAPATANKIAKSPITSQAEATVNKHRAILARALSQAVSITSKSKRT